MNKGKYAFWLVPSGEAYNLLKETIRHYSEMYSTPLFEPHITLISSLQGSVPDEIRGHHTSYLIYISN